MGAPLSPSLSALEFVLRCSEMSGAGRPPKPTRLKILQGNPGRRPLNKNEPRPQPLDLPKPPEHMHQMGKELWNEVVPELCRVRLLTRLDLPLLELFCESYAKFRQADEFIREHGEQFAVTNQRGEIQVVRENPAVSIRRNCVAAMNKIGQELGLSPASRSRFVVPEVPAARLLG